MRVLLDECVPRPLKQHLGEHEVATVQELGWSGKQNGDLLTLLQSSPIEVFITTDQNIEKQQNLRKVSVGLIVLIAKSNKLSALLPMVAQLREAIRKVARGEVLHIKP